MKGLRPIICIIFATLFHPSTAQQSATLSNDIRTLIVAVEGRERQLPVLQLGSDERLNISFDDMTHDYRRFTYTLQHCTWDWRTSENLFESEYMESSADEGIIEGYTQSMNTSVPYTHYEFSLPNDYMCPLLSGNYRLTISVDDTEADEGKRPVAVACFSVVEPLIGISATVSTNTEIDWNDRHQQLTLQANCGALNARDARTEFKAIVLQNRRWDNAVIAPTPTSIMGSTLLWEHDRRLAFAAGNEYRKFEMLSTRYPGMGMESTAFYPPYYHGALFPDEVRRNYLYDEDCNGCRVIRTDDGFGGSPQTESDYMLTHFTLMADSLPGTAVYVSGDWTHNLLTPTYRMHYNASTKTYETVLLLKQGYYNYLYLTAPQTRNAPGQTAHIEGDFHQTENEYDILLYHSTPSERYDRLVGYTRTAFRAK